MDLKYVKLSLLCFFINIFIAGCSTVTELDERQRLDGESIKNVLLGNSLYVKVPNGNWAEYFSKDLTTVAKAWGTWGVEDANAIIKISDAGEICWKYDKGEYAWTDPNHIYCALMYTDSTGSYFTKTLQNTYRPKKIGKSRRVEIRQGDHYGLLN